MRQVINLTVPDSYLEGDDYLHTTRAMRTYGGSFAHNIANAADVADLNNQKRLQDAFPDLFERYGPGTDFYKAMTERA